MLISLTNISLFAQDVPTDKEVGSIKNGLSYGGAAFLGNGKAGGYGEFGFGICQSGSFYVRNHITFGGGGLGSLAGFVEVGDKIIFGSHMNVTELFAVRTYALLGCGFAMFGGDPATGKSNLIKGGFIVTPQLGSGIELMFGNGSGMNMGGFFIEAVGTAELIVGDGDTTLLNQKYSAFKNTYVAISVGGRYYF